MNSLYVVFYVETFKELLIYLYVPVIYDDLNNKTINLSTSYNRDVTFSQFANVISVT